MKRVIALLLALMLLPIFTVVTQAAGTVPTMSQTEFKEVLKGQQTKPKFLFPDSLKNTDLKKKKERKKETYLLPAVSFCVTGFLSLLTDFQFLKLL